MECVNDDGTRSAADTGKRGFKTHPVRINVPGLKVVPLERNEMILGMLKMRSLWSAKAIRVTSQLVEATWDFVRRHYSLERTILDHLAIADTLDSHGANVLDLIFVDQGGTNWAGSVKAL